MSRILYIASIFLMLSMCINLSSASIDKTAEQILEETGVKGGLIVHIGCGDGKFTASLLVNDAYLVHGLDRDMENVNIARGNIRSLGIYGKVSVDRLKGIRLPYVENMVNLVVSEDLGEVPMEEMMRVLCPGGVAYIKHDESWQKTIKLQPEDIDEWTHYLHDASNNAVADDDLVGIPRHIQWNGTPKWTRSHDHLASISALVSSGGKIFYIVDEGSIASVALPSDWKLIARDAYNGVILWKRSIDGMWEGALRGFRSGPPEVSRRLIAIDDRVYVTLGYGNPVIALDAATGETIKVYENTKDATEILYYHDVLYVVIGDIDADKAAEATRRRGAVPPPRDKHILAIKAISGEVLWDKADDDTDEIMPTTMCIDDGRVFFENTSHVICLSAVSGKEIWKTERPISINRLAWSTPTLVVKDGVVISADRDPEAKVTEENEDKDNPQWLVSSRGGNSPMGQMIAYSAKDGSLLWTGECREAYNAPPDVLISNDLVWSGDLVFARNDGITVARDLFTGEIKKRRPSDLAFFKPGMSHHRCYRNKATNNYVFLGRSGVELVDMETGEGIANHWIRGTCQYGIMPCNGLLYVPPHSCACYITAKLNSFNALSATRSPTQQQNKDDFRLEKGAAYEQETVSADESNGDWPTYRHDKARSGKTEAKITSELKVKWQSELGNKLTSPVLADNMIFVASVDEHSLHALSADNGEKIWSFNSGGRIDSPPTVYSGMVIFGSADGWVYNLRSTDGELIWRFRAAPEDRRIVSYRQLESVWPVHGNILVEDGMAYFAAGRSVFLDGGIYFYKLDVKTGEKLVQRVISGRDRTTGKQPLGAVKGFGMPGILPDILSSDGNSIYMRQARFNRNGVELQENVPHLFSPAGFLDDSWWHRTYWIMGTEMVSGWGGWPIVGNQIPAGRILVYDDSAVYGFGRDSYERNGSHVGINKTKYRLFAARKQSKLVDAKDRRGNPIKRKVTDILWTQEVPLTVRAMVLTRDTLFMSGPANNGDQLTGLASLENGKESILYAVSCSDGKEISRKRLDSVPVFDGMIAAHEKLFITTTDGKVVCLGP
ncbi:PQQ-binding-like beta-propeller repeat protein [Candidatus Poribacteria bacterium]|nr:PQQ-binding-like beta-propeller repeat protein [Candidatus Poribacteria bacterium]